MISPNMRGGTLALLTFSVTLAAACGRGGEPPQPRATAGTAAAQADWFSEVAEASGLDFVHFNGMSGEFYYPEIMPPGVGAARLRQRRRPRRLPGAGTDARRRQDARPGAASAAWRRRPGRLYRNDLEVRGPTARAAPAIHRRHRGERHRACAATGWAWRPATSTTTAASTCTSPSFGANQMFRNNCDGTFTDVSKRERHRRSPGGACLRHRSSTTTATAGSICSSATTCNYSVEGATCSASARPAALDYCTPNVVPAAAGPAVSQQPATARSPTSRRRRWHRAASSGRRSASRPPTSTATAGSTSTSPTTAQPNQLWMNQRDGTFRNTALLAGAALTRTAKPRRAWAWTPAISTTTATRICSSPS